jgi:hypothetical protein
VDPRTVDAIEVPPIADAVTGLLDTGDAPAALQARDRALAMFRGDTPLSDAGDDA